MGPAPSMSRMYTEMSGLKELSMNMAKAAARKAKESSRWVKMKAFPSMKSRTSARIDPPRRMPSGRTIESDEIIAAEKRKLPVSSQKQEPSPSQATSAPAAAGERMRTR